MNASPYAMNERDIYIRHAVGSRPAIIAWLETLTRACIIREMQPDRVLPSAAPEAFVASRSSPLTIEWRRLPWWVLVETPHVDYVTPWTSRYGIMRGMRGHDEPRGLATEPAARLNTGSVRLHFLAPVPDTAKRAIRAALSNRLSARIFVDVTDNKRCMDHVGETNEACTNNPELSRACWAERVANGGTPIVVDVNFPGMPSELFEPDMMGRAARFDPHAAARHELEEIARLVGMDVLSDEDE